MDISNKKKQEKALNQVAREISESGRGYRTWEQLKEFNKKDKKASYWLKNMERLAEILTRGIKLTFQIEGEEILRKKVADDKADSGRLYVPKSWKREDVAIIRLSKRNKIFRQGGKK